MGEQQSKATVFSSFDVTVTRQRRYNWFTIHVKFWKCQCGRFIRKSEGLGGNGILYVNRRLLENGAIICKLGF